MTLVFKKIFTLVFVSFFLISSVDAAWITKKTDKSKEEIKEDKKQKNKWIQFNKLKSKFKKKEIKENKKKYKKEEKKITKEVKSWITKKSKVAYIDSVDKLPDGVIYFAGADETKDLLFYGYVKPDASSKKINGYYETSKGVGYLNDGKTTCKIGSTVVDVSSGLVTARVSGKCTNGIIFNGSTSQTKNSGMGFAVTKDGKNKFLFDFNVQKTIIAKIFETNKEFTETQVVERKLPSKKRKKITLKPNGKYYALLIGNSVYNDKGWDQLVSPVNDIDEIKKVLDNSYKFEKIITVKNGTKKEIFRSFTELSKLTTTNDYVLIYYSGHGTTKAEQAYWIPKDGSANWGNGDWININELNIFLTEIKAHHLAVMVDSCYVGGKFKGVNILDLKKDEHVDLFNQNLKDGLNLRARSVLASGSKGRVSDTAAGTNHSRFALALINILETANKQSVPLNMTNIALNVKLAFAGNFSQKPILYHPSTWQHGGGDFIFIPKKNLK